LAELDGSAVWRGMPGLLLELATGDVPRLLALLALAIRDRPGSGVALCPAGAARMREQDLDATVGGAIEQDAGAAPRSLRHRPGLRLVVDLGPLQPAAEVDVDRLPLGVRVERDVACLAVAVAGLLPAAERQVDLGTRRARVDGDAARL